jgi:uncharacterized low-complexity protein
MKRHSVRRPPTATGALLIGALGLGGLASAADGFFGRAPAESSLQLAEGKCGDAKCGTAE